VKSLEERGRDWLNHVSKFSGVRAPPATVRVLAETGVTSVILPQQARNPILPLDHLPHQQMPVGSGADRGRESWSGYCREYGVSRQLDAEWLDLRSA
jgi:hypothetical protein